MKVCKICKGENITQLYWVNPNTKEIEESLHSENELKSSDKWCSDCSDFVDFIDQ